PNLSGVWLDEASLMPEEAYTISIAALREAGEQGWLGATFTPKGPLHWTCEVFAGRRPDVVIFHARTSANPFNPPGFEATLARQCSPMFARQELGGEFVEMAGAEWPAAWFPESMWFSDWPTGGITLRVIALDPSKGRGEGGDDCAFVLLASDRAGHHETGARGPVKGHLRLRGSLLPRGWRVVPSRRRGWAWRSPCARRVGP